MSKMFIDFDIDEEKLAYFMLKVNYLKNNHWHFDKQKMKWEKGGVYKKVTKTHSLLRDKHKYTSCEANKYDFTTNEAYEIELDISKDSGVY